MQWNTTWQYKGTDWTDYHAIYQCLSLRDTMLNNTMLCSSVVQFIVLKTDKSVKNLHIILGGIGRQVRETSRMLIMFHFLLDYIGVTVCKSHWSMYTCEQDIFLHIYHILAKYWTLYFIYMGVLPVYMRVMYMPSSV